MTIRCTTFPSRSVRLLLPLAPRTYTRFCCIRRLSPLLAHYKLFGWAGCDDSRFLSCPVGTVQVRLDRLVPDIAMTDFEGSKVNFNEIEIGRQLGKGSFGVIYLGKFRGETVAVKRYARSCALCARGHSQILETSSSSSSSSSIAQ